MLKILLIIAILILLVIAVIYHDIHNFVVRKYDIETDKIRGDYTFVLLSDLHGYSYGKDNERLIKAIDKVSPDVILCAGDMFIGRRIDGEIKYQAGFNLLTNLAKRYPVYFGNGNHERKVKDYKSEYGNFFDRYRSMLQKAGVTVLENESISIKDKNIRITGLDLGLSFFKKVIKKDMDDGYLERVLGKSSNTEYQVLIAHNPQYFDKYSDWGADLSVSGHVHGGIIRLPFIGGLISPSIALFPKYDGGKFERNGKHMILSRGLGTHSIHMRFLNPGEADVICVHGRDN